MHEECIWKRNCKYRIVSPVETWSLQCVKNGNESWLSEAAEEEVKLSNKKVQEEYFPIGKSVGLSPEFLWNDSTAMVVVPRDWRWSRVAHGAQCMVTNRSMTWCLFVIFGQIETGFHFRIRFICRFFGIDTLLIFKWGKFVESNKRRQMSF